MYPNIYISAEQIFMALIIVMGVLFVYYINTGDDDNKKRDDKDR